MVFHAVLRLQLFFNLCCEFIIWALSLYVTVILLSPFLVMIFLWPGELAFPYRHSFPEFHGKNLSEIYFSEALPWFSIFEDWISSATLLLGDKRG